MAAVETTSDIVIQRPLGEVAAYAVDPDNAPEWYANIRSIEWRTPRPAQIGSRIAFVAQFLGRRLEYTYEIVELIPDTRLVMLASEGPFPMETTYTWEAIGNIATLMTLTNRGEPSGLARLCRGGLSRMIARENRKDLARLKELIEARGTLRRAPAAAR